MTSKKQKLARSRNWNKGLIKGIVSNFKRMQKVDSGLTSKERNMVNMIEKLSASLLKNWG